LNPRDTARITFSDLCKGLLKYFVDVHPFKVNSRTLERPFDLFQESFEQTPPPLLPTNLEKLGIIAAHRKHLTVGNEGIVMPGLRFNSTDLQATRRQIQSTYKTVVKFDPEDLGYIYVQHPKSLEWMYVPNCHPEYADNLSMTQHNAIRMQRKGALHARSAVEDYLRAKLELSELWQSMERGTKLKRDQKALIQFAGLSSTKFLANPDKHSVSASSKLATEDDFQQAESTVPDFDAYTFD
jgi:putative transposase